MLEQLPPLWAHQKAGIELGRRRASLGLFFDAGTGKSRTLLEILREEYNAQRKILPTLIFCPLSVCPQWRKQIEMFTKIPLERVHVLTKSGPARAAALAEIMRVHPGSIVITNYEAVQNKAFYRLLLDWRPECLVLDESHRIKNCPPKKGSRAEKIYPLADIAYRRFLLTGTPILNSLLDIFGQFRALDGGAAFGKNFFAFRARYFYDRNAGMPKFKYFPDWQPLPEAGKEVSLQMSAACIYANKADCLDLPPLVRIKVPVELSPEQKLAYLSMEKTYIAEIKGKETVAEFALTKGLRLQQLVAGFVQPVTETGDLDRATWVESNPRLDALEDLLDSLRGQKVIVWTVFKPTYGKIGEICERLKLQFAMLTGEQSAKAKQESIDNFCRGSVDVLIANPAAGGVGINLTEASAAIYFTRNYSLEQYLQSEARNFRGGSEMHKKITHYHILATGTIDEVIAEALIEKKNIGDEVAAWAKKTVDKCLLPE